MPFLQGFYICTMAENNKKKKGRRAYLDDFQTTVSGEMIYCGAYYVYQGAAGARKGFLMKVTASAAAAAVFAVLSGCVPAPGTLNSFYVLLPLLGSILSAISVLWGVIRLIAGGEKLREYVYSASVEELPLRTALCIGCAGLSILGELLHLILNGTGGKLLGIVLFLLAQGIVLVSSLFCRRTAATAVWKRLDSGKGKKTD